MVVVHLHRSAIGLLVLFALTTVASARSDEIKTERGSDGSLHISITGTTPPASSTDLDRKRTREEDEVSVMLSLQRTEIEKKLNVAAADLEKTRKKIRATGAETFQAYATGGGTDPALVASAITDAGRFADSKRARLDALRAEEHAELHHLAELYDDWAKLREAVKKHYGKAPSWWRDSISCPRCPTPEEIKIGLQ